ncbi:MAG: carboxyl transferase domain-containing protein [Nitriliruptorales bacterium]|nr:carboxyl transferase domain-containing protein [Nitriliruptorales bacterium]
MTCPNCGTETDTGTPGWCGACGTAQRIGARELTDWLLPGARRLASVAADADPLGWPDYPERREAAREETGIDEAVLAVRGPLGGSGPEVVAVVWDFRFLGGSMSSGVGQTVAAAIDHATDAGLPVVLLPATGGARMQEGMASLVQMAATSVALTRHGEARLVSVSVLRDPTTGGVFASHANLTDVVLAESGATIGFAGPRVAEAMTGGPLPEGSHTARGALAAGLVDAVVARPDLPAVLARVLAWPGRHAQADGDRQAARADDDTPRPAPVQPQDAWGEVEASRADDRPRTPDFLGALDVAFELRGDRSGGDDPTIRVALARLEDRPVVVVGMDTTRAEGRVSPGGYRKAWRGIGLAGRLGVPLVTLVDTPGADASAASEAGGIAHHIARTFQVLLDVPVPAVSLVIGEGGSGGALALAVGDRLLIQEHAIFSVIAPEGAAAILHRDASKAPEVAALLQPTAAKLHELGIADEVVAEDVPDPVAAAWQAVARHLAELDDRDGGKLVAGRRERWRPAGAP